MTAATVRRIRVQPLSARAELARVVRASMVIAIGSWMLLAADGATFRDGGANQNLLPFQVLIENRPSGDQRMFRDLQEGLIEAETRRTVTGRWPRGRGAGRRRRAAVRPRSDGEGRALRLDARAERHVRQLSRHPRQPNAPAWLLLVLEPDPAAPPDPAREDEEHHKLTTGVMLHVSTWTRADGRAANRIIRAPQSEGWTQLYAVGPSQTPTTPRQP